MTPFDLPTKQFPIYFKHEGRYFKKVLPNVYVVVSDGAEKSMDKKSDILKKALIAGTVISAEEYDKNLIKPDEPKIIEKVIETKETIMLSDKEVIELKKYVDRLHESVMFKVVNIQTGTGGWTGPTTLATLQDVAITNPANGQVLVYQGGKWINGAGGTTYTFSNGLTETSGTVRLGGTLTQNTQIDGGGLLGMNFKDINVFEVSAQDIELYSDHDSIYSAAADMTVKSSFTVGSKTMGVTFSTIGEAMYLTTASCVNNTAEAKHPLVMLDALTCEADYSPRVALQSIEADTSGGLDISAANGTSIGLLGAGNTANATWYGSHNYNAVTASRVAQFGASKTLESSTVTTTELGYLSGVTSAIQTQINGKQASDATLTALAGLTTAADTLIRGTGVDTFDTITYKNPAVQTYTGSITWTGTTAPSGSTTHRYAWQQTGNRVTAQFILKYATGGTALTQVEFDLPADMPNPTEWAGQTGSNDTLFLGSSLWCTSTTQIGTSGPRCFLRKNGTSGYEIVAATGSISNTVNHYFFITYFTA